MNHQEVDFNAIVQHLLKSNTQVELERKTGVNQVVISRLNSGVKSPNLTYKNGAALVSEYKKQLKMEARQKRTTATVLSVN